MRDCFKASGAVGMGLDIKIQPSPLVIVKCRGLSEVEPLQAEQPTRIFVSEYEWTLGKARSDNVGLGLSHV